MVAPEVVVRSQDVWAAEICPENDGSSCLDVGSEVVYRTIRDTPHPSQSLGRCLGVARSGISRRGEREWCVDVYIA
jgi:hypothetical protein